MRDTLRTHGVSDGVIGRTLEDIMLTNRGKSRSDVFAEELARIILKKDVPAKTRAVDSRLPSKELGQILLEKEFNAAVNSRDKTNRKKTKSTQRQMKSPAKPGEENHRQKGDARKKFCD